MSLRVLMQPHLDGIQGGANGIARVVEAYFDYLPQYDIELVPPSATSYDLIAAHAGVSGATCDVAHLHGLYWTADYPDSPRWQRQVNAQVVAAARNAKLITVPSEWVAESLRRDMRVSPAVLPHGIYWDQWQGGGESANYVLWNKNREIDVCSPAAVSELAGRFPATPFVTTYGTQSSHNNVKVVGLQPFADMRRLVQRAGVYLATAKETFGIGVLEAMASGVPVLGWAHGGILNTVQHGVNGYLAAPNDYNDLAQGLVYCQQHRRVLGENGREMARAWTWEHVCAQLADLYRTAAQEDSPTVGIVIPSYNYAEVLPRALDSAVQQTYPLVTHITVVDDGSPDDGATRRVVEGYSDPRVHYIHQPNAGVAVARNTGVNASPTKYMVCLDADDSLAPDFVQLLVPSLEKDRSLGVAFTGLKLRYADGSLHVGRWPNGYDYNRQVVRRNQVPTACLFRRSAWARLGGYRQRYSPTGAGAEDAEFWLRLGSIGYGGVQATTAPAFIYSAGTGHTSHGYKEVDWLAWHPWAQKGNAEHPFASLATPADGFSHPVRQYDQPAVSVIIPVGPAHQTVFSNESHGTLLNALDSLEAQTFRQWEAVVVWDSDAPIPDRLRLAYPYVRWQTTGKTSGPAAARNLGVQHARAPLITFLDSDDYYKPNYLSYTLQAWQDHKAIVYTDFEAHATGIDEDTVAGLQSRGHTIKHYDGHYCVMGKRALDYDWKRVHASVENPPYIWCLNAIVLPKAWHDAIGGFNETLASWEDYDYALRLSYAGYPFIRIPEELMVYLYHGGTQRAIGEKFAEQLLEHLYAQHQEIEKVGCSGCPKKRATVSSRPPTRQVQEATMALVDRDFIRCTYDNGNIGKHMVYGSHSFPERLEGLPMIRHENGGWKIHYSYRGSGQVFLVHKQDARDRRFTPVVASSPPAVPTLQPSAVVARAVPSAPTPVVPPKPLTESTTKSDVAMWSSIVKPASGKSARSLPSSATAAPPSGVRTLIGVGPNIERSLNEHGILTIQDLADCTLDDVWPECTAAARKAQVLARDIVEKHRAYQASKAG